MAAAAAANNANKIHHTNNTPTPMNSTGMSYIDVVNNAAAAAAAAAAAGMPPHGAGPQYDMGQQSKSTMHHPGAEHLVYMPNMAGAMQSQHQHHYLVQSLAAQHQQMPHMRPHQQVSGKHVCWSVFLSVVSYYYFY